MDIRRIDANVGITGDTLDKNDEGPTTHGGHVPRAGVLSGARRLLHASKLAGYMYAKLLVNACRASSQRMQNMKSMFCTPSDKVTRVQLFACDPNLFQSAGAHVWASFEIRKLWASMYSLHLW